jgi:hypothetical protein
LLKLRKNYQNIFNALEMCKGYYKKLSNFGKYRQNLIHFDENVLKIGILSPGITSYTSSVLNTKEKLGSQDWHFYLLSVTFSNMCDVGSVQFRIYSA